MSGVGGYGAIVVYDAQSGEDASSSAGSQDARGARPCVFRPPTPGYEENRRGAPAVATPGNVNDWEALSEEYGELQWARLFEPP